MKKNPDRREMPLKKIVESSENEREVERQRLADLIGGLLARYWLKQQTAKLPGPTPHHDTKPSAD
jgi:hypothetical protein